VLARVLRRLSDDYLAVYGHRVLGVETFTDLARHTGACYAAANFRLPGDTLGFSRSARRYHHRVKGQRPDRAPRRPPQWLTPPLGDQFRHVHLIEPQPHERVGGGRQLLQLAGTFPDDRD
jgi:hypothetical protein